MTFVKKDNWQAPSTGIPFRFGFESLRKDIYPSAPGFYGENIASTVWQPEEKERVNVAESSQLHMHVKDHNLNFPQEKVRCIERPQHAKMAETVSPPRNFQFSTLGRSRPSKSSQWEFEESEEVAWPDSGFQKPKAPQDTALEPKQIDDRKMSPTQNFDVPHCPCAIPANSQDPEDNANGGVVEEKWQENEIPEELGYIDSKEPEEIRNIVQEALDEHRALRASRMHTQAIVVRTTITISTAGSRASTCHPVVESSAISTNQSLDLIASRERLGAENLALESSSSVSSSIGDQVLRNLRTSPELLPTSSQESLGSTTDSSETGVHITEGRRRNQRLLKLLPGRSYGKQKKADSASEQPVSLKNSECTSCFDDIPAKDAIGVPCGHQYCLPCFSQLVNTAVLSEDTFPPQCCLQDIPRRILQSHISSKDLTTYDEKALEYAVPSGSRYYCGSPSCAKWVDTRKARRLSGGLQCPHCRFKMCTSCRGALHGKNEDCPHDFGLGAALEQAERAGWRRCYSCRTMVELNKGCRHITCKCRAEFCYTCGAKWQTCECTEADQKQREAEIAERLARYEAESRAEEAEVRAAIAAVEEAERRVAAEREAEERATEAVRQAQEAEEATRIEYERVEGINDYFQLLRGELQKIDIQQKEAIASRHEMHEIPSIARIQADLTSEGVYQKRVRRIATERGTILASSDKKIRELRQSHQTTLIATIQRHRDDQDTVFLQPIRGPETQRGAITENVLTALIAAQDLEIHTLQSQQEREIRKWQSRGAVQLAEFDAIMHEETIRFEKLHRVKADHLTAELKKVESSVASDWKWWEMLVAARTIMLDEDENRMIMSGADAPMEFKGKAVAV